MPAVKAHFNGKVIVLDEQIDLPKDEPLLVNIKVAKPKKNKKGKTVFDWIVENPIDDANLPTDLSYQHDHYLYGTSKKKLPRKKPKKS